jgi:hypothetical protein
MCTAVGHTYLYNTSVLYIQYIYISVEYTYISVQYTVEALLSGLRLTVNLINRASKKKVCQRTDNWRARDRVSGFL